MSSSKGQHAPPPRATRSAPAVPAQAAGRAGAGGPLACVLLAAATLTVYAHACGNGFVYDDADYVLTNPHVKAGLGAEGMRWALTAFHSANWHPLTWLSLQLDATLFGLAPWGYHLHNLLLHTAATLLLFLFLRGATGAVWRSAFVAGLFALHPLHVESVAWISERKDVLSACCWMLALLAYVHYARRPGWGRYLLVVLAFALGLLAKPMVVTLPCVLLLLDYWPLRRLRLASRGREPPVAGQGSQPGAHAPGSPQATAGWLLAEKLPLFVLAALSCVVTVQAQQAAGTAPSLEALPLSARIGNAMLAYVGYLAKTLWPSDLAVYYPYSITSLRSWMVLDAGALLLDVTALAVLARRRFPYLLVGWLWYVGTLVPVIGLVQVGAQALADRYTYLPLIGIFLAVSWGLADLAERWRCRDVVAGAAAVVLAACALLTWLQVHYWQDEVSLWTHALEVEPENPVAWDHLGTACLKEGQLDLAESYFAQFARLEPGNALAHCRLGMILVSRQKLNKAEEEYELAGRLDPAQADAHRGLGLIAFLRKRLGPAGDHFREALRLKPEHAGLHHDLGLVFEYQGDWERAADCYRRAVELDPRSALFHRELALALWQRGQAEAAQAHYSESSRIQPGWLTEADRQAWALATNRDPAGRDGMAALHLARQVCQATGEREPAYLGTLAAAFAEVGQFDQAVKTAGRALELAAGQAQLAEHLREALRLYEGGQPLREGAPGNVRGRP